MPKIVVLASGMGGLGAAYRLRGGTPGNRPACEELCGLAVVELRSDLCGALSHAVYAKVPPHQRRQHEHRLAGPADLPAKPRGGAAWRALAIITAFPLHHTLPISHRGRIRILSEKAAP